MRGFKIKFMILILLLSNLSVGCSSNTVIKSENNEMKKEQLTFRITWKAYSGRGEAIQKIVNSYNVENKDSLIFKKYPEFLPFLEGFKILV